MACVAVLVDGGASSLRCTIRHSGRLGATVCRTTAPVAPRRVPLRPANAILALSARVGPRFAVMPEPTQEIGSCRVGSSGVVEREVFEQLKRCLWPVDPRSFCSPNSRAAPVV